MITSQKRFAAFQSSISKLTFFQFHFILANYNTVPVVLGPRKADYEKVPNHDHHFKYEHTHIHIHTFHKIGFSSKIVHSHGWLSFPKGSSSGIHFIHLSSFCLDFTNFGWVGSEFWAGWFRTCSDFCCGFLFLKQCVASICSTSTLTQKIILDTWNGKAISK